MSGQVEIFHELLHQGGLLIVFLSEPRLIGLHEGEQFRDDRCDALKMVWSCVPFPAAGYLRNGHNCLSAGRIHRLDRGGENDVHPFLSTKRLIEAQLAWILREVFRRAELCRVHKDAHHHGVAGQPGSTNQGAVPFVQRPHRRYEPNGDPFAMKASAPVSHRRRRADNLHVRGSAVGGALQLGRDP